MENTLSADEYAMALKSLKKDLEIENLKSTDLIEYNAPFDERHNWLGDSLRNTIRAIYDGLIEQNDPAQIIKISFGYLRTLEEQQFRIDNMIEALKKEYAHISPTSSKRELLTTSSLSIHFREIEKPSPDPKAPPAVVSRREAEGNFSKGFANLFNYFKRIKQGICRVGTLLCKGIIFAIKAISKFVSVKPCNQQTTMHSFWQLGMHNF